MPVHWNYWNVWLCLKLKMIQMDLRNILKKNLTSSLSPLPAGSRLRSPAA
jgi:hypothetical protein